ncbi:hypothetical protein GX645_04690 [Candidatus Sumerlaeota bacterium]|nr:hypothetical protein [Candidatus Sumerlaeota bacterium]
MEQANENSDAPNITMRQAIIAGLIVGVALFFSFVLFDHKEPGWSVNSRFCLTMAIVDEGRLSIDDFANIKSMQTDDVAQFRGHLYSDKAIGVSLLAIAPMVAMRGIERMAQTHFSVSTLRYWTTICVSALSAALAGFFLFLYLSQLRLTGASNRSTLWGAVTVIVGIMLGTQYFGHATLLLSYAPAAMFLAAAMLTIQIGLNSNRFSCKRAFCCGLLAGLSILCETLWGVAAVGILAVIAWQEKHRFMTITPVLLGGMLLGVMPFILYSLTIFGTLTIPYEYERNEMFRTAMTQGFMGASWPNLKVLAYLTVLPYRGIFFHSPFLLLALPGLCFLWKNKSFRALSLMIFVVSVFYLLFNSAYYMWWGGWNFSPRHLSMLPILFAAPLFAFYVKNRACGIAMSILLVPALIIHFIVVCTDPQWPDTNSFTTLEMLLSPENLQQLKWVWYGGMLRSFLNGHAQGTILGGQMTIIVLLVVWIAAKSFILLSVKNFHGICKKN